MVEHIWLPPRRCRFESGFLHNMAKIDKKRKKLEERIEFLQEEMKNALIKKTSDTKEISVPEYTRKINELRIELQNLK